MSLSLSPRPSPPPHFVPTAPLDVLHRFARRYAGPGRFRDSAWPDADPAARTFLRIADEADHEAWLIRWPVGSIVALHDHGGAPGAAMMVFGRLTERVFSPSGARWRIQRWMTGSVREFPPGHLHEVVNESKDVALSLHVYAPRLDSMRFYSVNRGRLEARGTWTHTDSDRR